jgi:hypothetical protein
MYTDAHELELLADPRNSSAWGELSLMESLTHLPGERSKYVGSFTHTIEGCLTCVVSKLVHTLLMDTEAVFSGFSNAYASAGRTRCKLLTLLHKGVTGEEVRRLIKDSHDVGNQPWASLSFPDLDTIRS